MPNDPPRKSGRRRGEGDTLPADPGHLAEDDRGNVTWQWANDEVLQADDTAGAIERLRALVDPSLGIVDEDPPATAGHNPRALKTGYNPYDSGSLGKTQRKKKTDLRQLSKWVAAKRKAESGSSGESDK